MPETPRVDFCRSEPACDFDHWIVREFADSGEFTALVVLVEIAEAKVTPLCSTYFNVIGDEVEWSDMTVLFAGSGADWHGAAFFPDDGPTGGPLDNPTARLRLHELEARLDETLCSTRGISSTNGDAGSRSTR